MTSTAFQALRSVGAFALSAKSERRRNSLVILCYHGLSLHDEHLWWPHLYITPEQFRERMRCLETIGASVLPFDEALARLQKRDLPPRSVTITFDDGFVDFLQNGVPILSEYGYPSTLYLTTHYSNHRLPIINLVLDYVLWKSGRRSVHFPELGLNGWTPINTEQERQRVVRRLLDDFERRGMSTVTKDEAARGLAEHLGVDYDSILRRRMFQILSPEEVQAPAHAGVNVQLHTHRHRVPKDHELFVKEIDENRQMIIDATGKAPVHFCYPSGEYSPEFFGWLKACGVESATTCEIGLASQNSPNFRLPRVLDDSGMRLVRFESVVSGLFV